MNYSVCNALNCDSAAQLFIIVGRDNFDSRIKSIV